MKKLLFLFLLAPFILLSQEKFERKKYYQLSDGLEFKIIMYSKSENLELSSTGTGGTVIQRTDPGYKAILMWFKIENNTNEKVLVDLTQFQVVDDLSNVYDAYVCAGNGLNMFDCDTFEFNIKPNKGRQARMYFSPQIPKTAEIKYLRVSGVDVVEF
ncbi:MAG: hypothetical protein R2793_05425 [Flavobacteriaceae bacterium]